jgi:hypothetical protein
VVALGDAEHQADFARLEEHHLRRLEQKGKSERVAVEGARAGNVVNRERHLRDGGKPETRARVTHQRLLAGCFPPELAGAPP